MPVTPLIILLGLSAPKARIETPPRLAAYQWEHTVSDVLYFVSGSEGQWHLSDGNQELGHIEQVGMEFTVIPTVGSILEGIVKKTYPSKQEAMSAIEIHTGKMCRPAVESS
jgi:hypothetical protein